MKGLTDRLRRFETFSRELGTENCLIFPIPVKPYILGGRSPGRKIDET
jgi:hypothetical protein